MITHHFIPYDQFYDYAINLCQNPYEICLLSADIEHKNGHHSFVMADPFVKYKMNY